jgi:hypothetical protein
VLVEACAEYRSKGVFNCLLSDGDWLFCFARPSWCRSPAAPRSARRA